MTSESRRDAEENNPLLTLVDVATSLAGQDAATASSTVSLKTHPNEGTAIAQTTPSCRSSPKIGHSLVATAVVSSDETDQKKKKMNAVAAIPPITTKTMAQKGPIDKKESFAEKLMGLLLRHDEYGSIVTFLPDDESFGIVDARKFTDHVMPDFFGIRAFSSFVRKLTRWGFERIMEKKTHNVDVFRHALFRKGDWKSCRHIKCVGRRRQSSTIVPRVARSDPLPNNNNNNNNNMASRKKDPSPPFYQEALQDITSHVVKAALETLKRDERCGGVSALAMYGDSKKLQQLMAQQQVQAEMRALQGSGLSTIHTKSNMLSALAAMRLSSPTRERQASPRSTMSFQH